MLVLNRFYFYPTVMGLRELLQGIITAIFVQLMLFKGARNINTEIVYIIQNP